MLQSIDIRQSRETTARAHREGLSRFLGDDTTLYSQDHNFPLETVTGPMFSTRHSHVRDAV